ncbi:arrestin domain-containing protein 3-like [Genypterus blacodes]|uniref:arrestin domain-containing protein 3-like n=1 Tax=Genypterus blacodes TaxID=154954 RepID=UPI003F771AF3
MFQSKFKNFNINIDALDDRNTCSSGARLTGQISFTLSKETKISSIGLRLRGNVKVRWTTGGGGSRRRRRSRKVYSAKVHLFDLKDAIVQESGAIRTPIVLKPGTHVYPFTCQIPHGDFPSSFQGVYGSIIYNLTVEINRPWHMSKDFVTTLNFVHHIDTSPPELHAPLEGTNSMTLGCLWWASAPISVKARLEKKLFARGEAVKVTCYLSNGSSWTATPKVSLIQNQTFYTSQRINQRSIVTKMASVGAQPVRGHTEATQRPTEMMLTIPSTVIPTISNCTIIEVNYLIKVSFGVRCAADLQVLFPIIIHDETVPDHPPPYM